MSASRSERKVRRPILQFSHVPKMKKLCSFLPPDGTLLSCKFVIVFQNVALLLFSSHSNTLPLLLSLHILHFSLSPSELFDPHHSIVLAHLDLRESLFSLQLFQTPYLIDSHLHLLRDADTRSHIRVLQSLALSYQRISSPLSSESDNLVSRGREECAHSIVSEERVSVEGGLREVHSPSSLLSSLSLT